jgi:hypothetical protein
LGWLEKRKALLSRTNDELSEEQQASTIKPTCFKPEILDRLELTEEYQALLNRFPEVREAIKNLLIHNYRNSP